MMWLTSLLSIESWILLGTALAILRYYIHRKWQFLAKMNIPHDPPSILNFGTLRNAFSERMFFKDNEDKAKYGPIYGAYAGLDPIIICHDLEIMRQIYTKEFSSFPDRQKVLTKMNGKVMNHALVAITGKKWKRIRSALSPTFSISKLKQILVPMGLCIDQTIAVLQKKRDSEKGIFQPRLLYSNLALDIVSTSALGARCGCQSVDGTDSELANHIRNVLKVGLTSSLALLCFFFPPAERVFEIFDISIFPYNGRKYVQKFTEAVIKERTNSGQRRSDLLQLMLDVEVPDDEINEDSTEGLSRIELIGNAMLMVGAGYENTANTMTFLSYNLAFHPDVQARLQQEVDDVIQEKGQFDYETLNSMKYLDMCFNESLRLYLPPIANSRVCSKDITVNGLAIPKGVLVNFPVFALAHSTDYWEKPWEFNPERMADMSQIDPMVFQPFGAGPRNCIGLRFAQLEVKLTFCKLLQKFSFMPVEDTPKPPLKLGFGVSVRPGVDFQLRIVPRKDT